TIRGTVVGEFFGFSVAAAGKVNNDAIGDLIVGAPGDIVSAAVRPGAAYVFYGAGGGITATTDGALSGSVGTTLTDPSGLPATLFGFSVSSAGDVDNDTHDDVIVGAPLSLNITGSFGTYGANGKAYVFYGSGNASGIASPSLPVATLTSGRAGAGLNLLFGYSVGKAGNVTGDASGDVLVGEPGSLSISDPLINTLLSTLGFSGSSTVDNGQAYVFQGRSGTGISTSATYTASATAPNLLGTSVNGVGDVDGDGFQDFIVGQPSGILDFHFNLTTLAGFLSAGPTSLLGTMTTATNGGLLTRNSTGNSQLFFGFTGPLPVTLLDFSGHSEQADVVLNWSTAMEQNSSYFQIERSQDNQHFTVIGKVAAAGNASQQTNYTYTDASPASGNNYYRLKMVDLDGTATYSRIVVINFNNLSEHVIATYPNPAYSSFQLQFRNMATGRYNMQFISSSGQVIFARQVQVSDPVSYSETISLSQSLAAGSYLIRVMDNQNHSFITRIAIQ
ncbi:MAG: FG-GAP repeat protein, partial [Bacteroidetes bacterium]|nr:FG-GAP repeat protein [Bacteroidota bacterium]